MSINLTHKKTRILLLGSSPQDEPALKINKEFKLIKDAIDYSKNTDEYKILQEGSITINDFYKHLKNFKPHIIHFAGHSDDNGIYLETENGLKEVIENISIINMIKRNSKNIQCIILNSCLSHNLAIKLSEGEIIVIGTVSKVSDESAINFSYGFYHTLSMGESYFESFNGGIDRVGIDNFSAKEIPALYKNGVKRDYNIKAEASSVNQSRYSVLIAVYIFVFLAIFSAISMLFEKNTITKYIVALILVALVAGITSLDKISYLSRRAIEKVVNNNNGILRKSTLYTMLVIFLILPLTVIYCDIQKYTYKNNISSLKEIFKKNPISLESSNLIYKLSRRFSTRNDFYLLLANKTNALRDNVDDETFRKMNRFVYNSLTNNGDINKFIGDMKNSTYSELCCLRSTPQTSIDPLLRVTQIYLESEKNVIVNKREQVLNLIRKLEEEPTPRRQITTEILNIEMLSNSLSMYEKDDYEKVFKKIVDKIDIIKYIISINKINSSFISSDEYFQALDYIAQLEVNSCNINKALSIYKVLLDKRRQIVNSSNDTQIIWKKQPEKLFIYWVAAKINNDNIPSSSVSKMLNSLEAICPGYIKKIENGLSLYDEFIDSSYKQSWRDRSISYGSFNDNLLKNLVANDWRF